MSVCGERTNERTKERISPFVRSLLLEMRFLELTSRGHPNCFGAEWDYLLTSENDKTINSEANVL